jgi:hypothetical protein
MPEVTLSRCLLFCDEQVERLVLCSMVLGPDTLNVLIPLSMLAIIAHPTSVSLP